MNKKKRRDRQADFEKELLLNPEKIAKERKRKKRTYLLCTLLGLLAVVGMGYASFQAVRAVGKANLKNQAITAQPQMMQKEEEAPKEEEQVKWQEGWIRYQGKVYAYNEDIRTFLFMGIDKNSEVKEVAEGTNGGQADALFLAVMNPHKESIQVIGINRNTIADIDVYNDQGAYVDTIRAQLAVQHGFGNGVEESCEYQVKAVSRFFYSLPIHGYAAINMSAIETLNDAVGGVDVTVLEDLTRIDASLVEGQQVHLQGKSAFWYVKYRDISKFGSADLRLARQKQYLNGFIGAAKKAAKQDISVALKLYQAIAPMMTTNVSADEVAYLAPILVDYGFDQEEFYMIPGETVMGDQFEEFYAEEEALYQMILNIFYEEVAIEE